MLVFFYIILASLIVSAISLLGAFILLFRQKVTVTKLRRYIGFAIGVLLAAVFFDLLPTMHESSVNFESLLLVTLISLVFFLFLERFLHWHHCRGKQDCHEQMQKKSIAKINLVGDGIHNFVDGVIIAAAFMVNPGLGLLTTIAVALHEIPQEVSDFGILLYAGFTKKMAVIANLLFALLAVGGAILTYLFLSRIENILPYFIAVAAGNFLYLALADLMPELRETKTKRVVWQLLFVTPVLTILNGSSTRVGVQSTSSGIESPAFLAP